MSLKFDKLKVYKVQIIWGVIGAVVAACLLRVAIWEHNYYKEKEGSERAQVVEVAESEEVDETEVTEEEKAEYTVAADRPRYLSIEKLGVTNARVLPMGTTSDGALDTPNNIFDVGWYVNSAAPGNGGTALFDGHNGGPNVYGVFKRLPELNSGDLITIEMGDGRIFTYSVYDNYSVPLADSDAEMATAEVSPVSGKESITLITCTGEWSQVQQTYLSRQFVRAVRVE